MEKEEKRKTLTGELTPDKEAIYISLLRGHRKQHQDKKLFNDTEIKMLKSENENVKNNVLVKHGFPKETEITDEFLNQKVYYLPEEHQIFALKLIRKHITKRFLKKGCNRCNNTGLSGLRPDGVLVPCENCVDLGRTVAAWNKYLEVQDEIQHLAIKTGKEKENV